jgi:hypothetical protein
MKAIKKSRTCHMLVFSQEQCERAPYPRANFEKQITLCDIASKNNERFGSIKIIVRFEVFTAVTMKNGVFWDVTPCGSCKN